MEAKCGNATCYCRNEKKILLAPSPNHILRQLASLAASSNAVWKAAGNSTRAKCEARNGPQTEVLSDLSSSGEGDDCGNLRAVCPKGQS